MMIELVLVVAIVAIVAVVAIVFGRSVRADLTVQRVKLETGPDSIQHGEMQSATAKDGKIIQAGSDDKLRPPRQQAPRKRMGNGKGKKK